MCKKENRRRLMYVFADDDVDETVYEEDDGGSDGLLGESKSYNQLCRDKNKNSLIAACVFVSLDWLLVLFAALYWHLHDKYSAALAYSRTALVWHETSKFTIKTIPSKMSFIGRILGAYSGGAQSLWLKEKEAVVLHKWLLENTPWNKPLDPRMIGKEHIEPLDYASFGRSP